MRKGLKVIGKPLWSYLFQCKTANVKTSVTAYNAKEAWKKMLEGTVVPKENWELIQKSLWS